MGKWNYMPYYGPEPYLYIRAHKNDEKAGLALANQLLGRNYRVFFDVVNENEPEDTAAGILNCHKAVFFLRKEAEESLDMRNSINYALKEKKDVFIIKEKGYAPGHGLDMQLANIPSVLSDHTETIVEELEQQGVLKEDMIGDGLKLKPEDKRKKWTILLLAAGIVLLLIASSFIIHERIRYVNSPAYIFRDFEGSDYLDISMFKEDVLEVLSGKQIGTLYMENMDIRNVSAIQDIDVTYVDIAHNPNVTTLWYLTRCRNIECVTISQDMLRFSDDLLNSGIAVKVVR